MKDSKNIRVAIAAVIDAELEMNVKIEVLDTLFSELRTILWREEHIEQKEQSNESA